MKRTAWIAFTILISSALASEDTTRAKFNWAKQRIETAFQAEFKEKMGAEFRLNLHLFPDGRNSINGYFPTHPNAENIYPIPLLLRVDNGFSALSILAVACHELGHGIADGDKKTHPDRVRATEGEADYFVVPCVKKILANLPHEQIHELHDGAKIDSDTVSVCAQASDLKHCELILQSAKDELHDFGTTIKENYLESDATVLTALDLMMEPKKQCRLDTFRAAYFEQARPACWHFYD